MDVSRSLPYETLPEMDETFAAQLTRGRGLDDLELTARLTSRYATQAIESQVKAFFEPAAGRWACYLQDALLAYFLRVDEPYGLKAFSQCQASRQTGCWRTLFTTVGQQIWTPGLEKLAVEALSSTNADVASDAAAALKPRGWSAKTNLVEQARSESK